VVSTRKDIRQKFHYISVMKTSARDFRKCTYM
jgi:hypothetical protein